MVLLTSSAVSVAISGAVICAFTFLLFLSGYVLQQRTVRSLQEALRQPPEAPRPIPTLPHQFVKSLEEEGPQRIDEVIVAVDEPQEELDGLGAARIPQLDTSLPNILLESDAVRPTPPSSHSVAPPQRLESLAYILTIPQPEDVCSAALFAGQQRQFSTLPQNPAIIFLYPSTWETSPSPQHIAALTFLRDIQDQYSLIYHPVEISTIWSGVGVNSQLLSELQSNRWDFDRMLYLKSPGMAMDTSALDTALRLSSIKKSWAPVTASAGHDPGMLFWSRRKGLMMPRGDMRGLTVSAMTSHSNHHAGEMDIEVLAKSAAYMVFDEVELEHRRKEKEWYGGLFERFERERSGLCKGKGLLSAEQDKVDLRRKL